MLQNPTLLKSLAYIDGTWMAAADGNTYSVGNPASGSVLGQVPDMGQVETEQAIQAAQQAFVSWRQTTAKERSALLKNWHRLVLENVEDLALLLTSEQGKPLVEARGEIVYGASFIEWFAEEGKRAYGSIIPTHADDRRILVNRQPIGVCALITPWNFPNAMITRKVAPALAVGCCVVIKPAEDTPLSALALAELAEQAGIPKGVINIITTQNPAVVGELLATHPIVKKLSFTGSTAVGKLLYQQCSSTVKKITLELGGNAPFIVFDDADIDAAVVGAVASKYRNSGQTCVCTNRFLVQETVHDEFVEKLCHAVKTLQVGDGCQPNIQQGPLINDAAITKIESLLADAKQRGAQVLVGGNRHPLGGTFFEPTVLANVTTAMRIAREEVFGPVATVLSFKDEAQAVDLANNTEFGLAAYFYSRDMARIWRVSEALEYGMVAVNEGILSTESAPFGGVKESGLGREGAQEGLLEYLESQYVCLGGINREHG